jgi:uncharacterized damage-inducible protein DinB
MSSIDLLLGMAENNAWANHRLLGACAKLTQEEWTATRTSFFPSLRATLLHVYLVDLYYIDALSGGGRGYAIFDDETPFETAPALRDAQRALDAQLVKLVADLGHDGEAHLARKVKIERRDHDQHERVDDTLLHLFEHQIHHRGQAHAMLAGTRIAPPQLDEFFMSEEAPLRAAELRELGLRVR